MRPCGILPTVRQLGARILPPGDDQVAKIVADLPTTVIEDLSFVQRQVRNFAQAQRDSMLDVEIETLPGVRLGHKHVPVTASGAYVPGGRYPLTASAHMTVVTAKVAGVERVAATTPPNVGTPPPVSVAAMHLAGADEIFCLAAYRPCSARLGDRGDRARRHDRRAGQRLRRRGQAPALRHSRHRPARRADRDPRHRRRHRRPRAARHRHLGQPEHGPTSPWCWSPPRPRWPNGHAEAIDRRIAGMATGRVAREAWESYGEVVVVDSFEEAVALADELAAEHVEIHTADPGALPGGLHNYGSIFLGENDRVPYGDKGIGTNHVLPTPPPPATPAASGSAGSSRR